MITRLLGDIDCLSEQLEMSQEETFKRVVSTAVSLVRQEEGEIDAKLKKIAEYVVALMIDHYYIKKQTLDFLHSITKEIGGKEARSLPSFDAVYCQIIDMIGDIRARIMKESGRTNVISTSIGTGTAFVVLKELLRELKVPLIFLKNIRFIGYANNEFFKDASILTMMFSDRASLYQFIFNWSFPKFAKLNSALLGGASNYICVVEKKRTPPKKGQIILEPRLS